MKTVAKFICLIGMAIVFAACTPAKRAITNKPAPLNLFQTMPDETEKKSLVGIITENEIKNDTAFGWYAASLKFYKADSATVQTIRAKKNNVQLLLFMGTWCHDSQQLVPKYFTTLDAAGFPPEHLTIVGTDRNKKTIANMHEIFHITNVPTMIVLQNGKEVDRIVEYGKTTFVDKELGAIFKTLP